MRLMSMTSLVAAAALVVACGTEKNTASVNQSQDTAAAQVDAGGSSSGGTSSGGTSSGGTSSGGTSSGGASSGGTSGGDAVKCSADADCTSGICIAGACSVTCTGLTDCGEGESCSLDNKGRTVCHKPLHNLNIGVKCGHDGQCKDGLKCLGRAYSAQAVCTATCKADIDCPADFECLDIVNEGKVCMERAFCGGCQHDGQCPEGGTCMKMSGGSFCTTPCTAGSTECPRYARCQGGQCVHRAGTCIGEGNQCDPCNTLVDGQCKNGPCLQYGFSKESFCADTCTTSCPTGFKCAQVSQTGYACVPDKPKTPSCVGSIGSMYEVGAVMDDFAMVGMVDVDGDESLVGESPRIIHLSDFADFHDLILINVSAVWCSACQKETKDFKLIYNKYNGAGVVLFQILNDGSQPGHLMTMDLLKQWNQQLKPIGTVGMDPNRISSQWNTGGSSPLNILIDAKTRKVLWKKNGYSFQALDQAIKQFMPKQ